MLNDRLGFLFRSLTYLTTDCSLSYQRSKIKTLMWTNFIFQTITKHQHQYMCACWCLSVFLDVSQCVSQETWSKGIHWFDLCSFCSVWLVLLTHKLWKFQLFCQMLRLDTKWAYKIFKSKGCSIAFRGSWGYAWRTPQHHWPSQSLPWLLWSTGKKSVTHSPTCRHF